VNWRRWPWLEEGVLPLLVLLLRLSWLWPWLVMLGRWLLPPGAPPILSLWNAALLLAGGALTVRLLRVDPEKPRRARLLAACIGLAALALTLWLRWERVTYALWDVRWLAHLGESLVYWGENISVPFVTLLLAAWLWLRGMRDRPAPTHDDVWSAFVTGFVALALLLLAARLDPAGLPEAAGRGLLLFFATGMAALALAGLRQARNVRQKDAPLLANRYWLTSILVTILALLAIGLVLGVLITPESVAQIFGWTKTVASWLLALIGYVAYVVAYVLFLFLTPLIEWVQAHLGEPRPLEPAGVAPAAGDAARAGRVDALGGADRRAGRDRRRLCLGDVRVEQAQGRRGRRDAREHIDRGVAARSGVFAVATLARPAAPRPSAGRAVLVAGRRGAAAARGACGVPGVPGGNGATRPGATTAPDAQRLCTPSGRDAAGSKRRAGNVGEQLCDGALWLKRAGRGVCTTRPRGLGRDPGADDGGIGRGRSRRFG